MLLPSLVFIFMAAFSLTSMATGHQEPALEKRTPPEELCFEFADGAGCLSIAGRDDDGDDYTTTFVIKR
jgi:hypothetical protein